MKTVHVCIILFLVFLILLQCRQQENFLQSPHSYLGQNPPGTIPQIFARGIISMKDAHEYCITMTPDGKEIYFSRAGKGVMMCIWTDSEWTGPKKAAFSEKYVGGEVHIMHDGKRMLMNRYAQLDSGETGGIWSLCRTNNGWNHAEFVLPNGMRATSTLNGTIYTTDITGFRIEGQDGGIIAKWTVSETGYTREANPKGGVNTQNVEAHPFIAPDESYIIFNSRRPGGKGESDLYICFKSKEESWSEAVNMEPLNSETSDWCATCSPDGRNLFFTRNGPDGGDIYWVSTKIIKELKPDDMD